MITEALIVAIGAGGALTTLAGALSAWLSHKRNDLKITITDSDGHEIIVTAPDTKLSTEDVTQLVREALENPEKPVRPSTDSGSTAT